MLYLWRGKSGTVWWNANDGFGEVCPVKLFSEHRHWLRPIDRQIFEAAKLAIESSNESPPKYFYIVTADS